VSYRIAADVVMALHLAFIAFVVAGGFLAWRWRRLAVAHLPAATWGAIVELRGWECPLTPLEDTLRRRAGLAGYEGGFVEHHLVPIVYPPGLTAEVQLVLGGLVIAINALAYVLYWRRSLHRRAPADA
jgi:hypothetical protein